MIVQRLHSGTSNSKSSVLCIWTCVWVEKHMRSSGYLKSVPDLLSASSLCLSYVHATSELARSV